jgi:glycerophosphoryl diester phosphodiesterase
VILVAHRTPATRAGCEKLAAAGASVFEADVQVDDHGAVVVTHYLPVGVGGRFERDNWRLRWHTGRARDPRLAEVAALVPADRLILLDLKERRPDRRARLVAALIDGLPDRSRFRVCGHPEQDVATLRAAGFRTWRSVGNRRHLAAALTDGHLADEAVTVRHSLLTGQVVTALHERVPQVVAWTVNNVARAGRLRDLGVDGVTTDSIGVLHALAPNSH